MTLDRSLKMIICMSLFDLRQIIEDDYLYVTIQEKLIQAAHEYYVQEGINDGMTREEAENVELIGNEYSCPIPEAWK